VRGDAGERRRDLALLDKILDEDDHGMPTYVLIDAQREAFTEMRTEMRREIPRRCGFADREYARWSLSEKQRRWVVSVLEQHEPTYEGDLVSSGKVPRGREVATIPALRPENLPKAPPGRR